MRALKSCVGKSCVGELVAGHLATYPAAENAVNGGREI
jgi:hypothetical protein